MAYEELTTLMGAYFHEDFDEIWSAFEVYLGDAAPDDLVRLAHEVDTFLASTDPADVSDETRRLGSCVWLGDEPQAYVDWIREIGRRAQQASRASRAG